MNELPQGTVVLAGNFRDLKDGVKVVQPKATQAYLPFKTLFEFDSEQAYVSAPQHNGDWEYFFVIRVMDWREAIGDDRESIGDDDESKYNVGLYVVSPQAAGLHEVMQAIKSSGYGRDDFKRLKDREARRLFLVEALMQYGVNARLTDEYGNNRKDLMRVARQEAFKARSLFGFYMDRQQNAIGDSGWDFVAGNIGGSRDRRHQQYLESRGLTEEEFQERKEKRAEEAAKVVSVPVKLEPYVDGKKPMPLDKAHALWREGKLVFVERFVGGFADRGGSWHGPDEREGVEAFDNGDADSYGSTTVGNPQEVIPARRKASPKAQFICSLDESGQFQTYWSLWRIK
jgi:hypothetical protein